MKKPYIPSQIASIADDAPSDTLADMLKSALSAVREHLELDIAYMSEFVDGDTVFREVIAPQMTDMIADGELGDGLQVGKSLPKMETYCHHIMDGLLPTLITDTNELEISRNLQVTKDLKIAAHVGIPLVLKDGTKFGMFCGISHTPKPTMNERDLRVMQMFANMVTEHLDSQMAAHQRSGRMRDRIDALVDQNDFEIAYQPIESFIQGLRICGRDDAGIIFSSSQGFCLFLMVTGNDQPGLCHFGTLQFNRIPALPAFRIAGRCPACHRMPR